jgi:hypothetical protein
VTEDEPTTTPTPVQAPTPRRHRKPPQPPATTPIAIVVEPEPEPPAPAPEPAPDLAPDPPDDPLDVALRNRLVAALRPRLTVTVARMYVDQLLPEVKAYGEDMIQAALAVHSDVVAEMVTLAQDVLDIMATQQS